ncbi:Uncharacterised protein [Vibrio cholerae]|nr:Uncharacterised protein [Vibrio cholerae]
MLILGCCNGVKFLPPDASYFQSCVYVRLHHHVRHDEHKALLLRQ